MDCAHHWIIDPPDGGTSLGTCQKCGETREFNNSLQSESPWAAAEAHRIEQERARRQAREDEEE